MMRSLSRSPTISTDLQNVRSIYIPKEETCFDRCFPYFYYYICCGFIRGR